MRSSAPTRCRSRDAGACTRKLGAGADAKQPKSAVKPSYVTVRDAHLPAAIDGWNGQTYRKTEVAAMNVREGDRVVFWDLTGDVPLYGIARVTCADYDPKAHRFERITLWPAEWRGADGFACELRTWMRPMKITYGTRDRVTVWRAS